MKVLILSDRSTDGYGLRRQVEEELTQAGCEVQTVELSADEIKPCLGCFKCWVKTPGLCIMTNDCANGVSGMLMRSDAVVLLSRMAYGGFSPDIKAFLDRNIPNILPFFEIYHGEMHHRMRYGKFPWWIAVGYGDSTEEELVVFRELTERNALNLRPQKYFCLTAQNPDDYSKVLQGLRQIFAEEAGA